MDQQRQYPQLSACGINCGLCPRYYTDGSSRCPGCGGIGFEQVRPTCGVISCCKRKGIEYCYQCEEYPCPKVAFSDEVDSFITHKNIHTNFEAIRACGIEAYQKELAERMDAMQYLLKHYNDGRRKTFYSTAANLLCVEDIRTVMHQISETVDKTLPIKEQAKQAVALFEDMANSRNISLQLRKK
ncbi:DUF3795 domain-containing protein [Eubacteriales bacterium OttesenSCG-928-N14]|nr:DUF3795 domain-containing protein [Eubacteriales bacterium OttesenSCG-928-N14]